MSSMFGIALSRVAGGAPFSITPVSGLTNQAIFAEPTEYKLDDPTPSAIISTISPLVNAPEASLALSLPVGLPDEQSRAIRDAIPFTMDHSTAVINLRDYRATSSDGGALNILFIDITPGQAAAKLSSAEIEMEDDWLITPEEKTVLGSEPAGDLPAQEVIDKLVNPTVRASTRLHRIYIFHPERSSSELSSALENKFPGTPIKWVSLTDISRGAAASLNRRPAGETVEYLGALLTDLPVGITLGNGQIVTVVPKNIFLPDTRTVVLTTSRDNQTTITLQFVTGDSPSGKAVLEGLRPQPKGAARIQVTIDMDQDGETVATVEDLDSELKQVTHLDNVTKYTTPEVMAYRAKEDTYQIERPVDGNGVIGELPE